MSLQKKSFLIIFVTWAVLFIIITVVSLTFLLNKFEIIEKTKMGENIERLHEIFRSDIDNLSIKLSDWANWDDTYYFMIDRNKKYVESNLKDVGLDNLKINFMIFVDNQGKIIEKKSYDFLEKKGVIFPEDFSKHLNTSGLLIQAGALDEEKKGIILLSDRILMFAARPILNSNAEGPSHGTLIFARYLDDEKKKNISQRVRFNIDVIFGEKITKESRTQEIFNQLILEKKSSTIINSSQSLTEIYLLYKDIYNKPIVLFKSIQTRDIYQQGIKSVFFFLMTIALSGLVFMIVVYLFLSEFILKKINKFAFDVNQITSRNDFKLRITVGSKDEFGALANDTNKMLDNLQELQIKTDENKQFLLEKVKEIESKNKDLQNNKLAMINLLEDSKALEEELEKEKESVEKKIKERTSQLVASISSLSIGLIMIDETHKVLFFNRKALKIFGLPKDSIKVFDDFLNLFPKDSTIFKIHDEYHKEKILVEKKGEVAFGSKILNVTFLPILKKINEVIEVLGSIVLIDDITEAKLVQRSKDEFFSIASHELRTPLTAIRGNTDLINQYFGEQIKDVQLKEMISDIHESSVRLISIVNDFLETSRLELHKTEFKKEKVNLSGLIEKTIQEFQVTGSRRKLHLEFQKPTEIIPEVMADKDRIKQILINLIGNGFKCTKEGGIKIILSMENNFVKVSVVDTGLGISKQGQNLLFRKFQQTGENLYTRDTSKGTGLGLYISRLMVEGMGGKIWLEKSEVGKGSTFSFSLPI